MPKFEKTKYGWRCSCSKFFGEGVTRAIAFDEWKSAKRG